MQPGPFPPPAIMAFITLFLPAPARPCPSPASREAPGPASDGRTRHPDGEGGFSAPLGTALGTRLAPAMSHPSFAPGQGPARQCTPPQPPTLLSLPPRGPACPQGHGGRIQPQPLGRAPLGRGSSSAAGSWGVAAGRQGRAGMLRQPDALWPGASRLFFQPCLGKKKNKPQTTNPSPITSWLERSSEEAADKRLEPALRPHGDERRLRASLPIPCGQKSS